MCAYVCVTLAEPIISPFLSNLVFKVLDASTKVVIALSTPYNDMACEAEAVRLRPLVQQKFVSFRHFAPLNRWFGSI